MRIITTNINIESSPDLVFEVMVVEKVDCLVHVGESTSIEGCILFSDLREMGSNNNASASGRLGGGKICNYSKFNSSEVCGLHAASDLKGCSVVETGFHS